jgi:hypothetical protein
VPWTDLTRLALAGGAFPPAYRPVTEAEIAASFAAAQGQALAGAAPALNDDTEYARLAWLLERYRSGGGGRAFHGCSCKEHPLHLRLSGRVVAGYSELGDRLPAEGGLGFVNGHNLALEPTMVLAAGAFWSVAAVRINGRWARGGVAFDGPAGSADPLTWPGWAWATGRADVRRVRLSDGVWQAQFTRALVGAQLGHWSLSAGWDQRRTGPGLSGDLNLDYQGRAFPALTVRRTRPFRWRGVMTHLAPDQTLLRTGVLSRRLVTYQDEFGGQSKDAHPWFFQWLVGWNVTSWFRTHLNHTVMAVAREGTLWPDLLQINFPLVGTTWREGESGPITDRIFAVQMEFRWREAPWPVLPARAGRLYWDYGGTDFLPSGPAGVVPELSVPASVLGCELLSPRWDLGLEYAELRHESVLWYSNGGFVEGYSHLQTPLGHQLGGSGEAVMGLVRLRPARGGWQMGLQGRLARWGTSGLTPGSGERRSLALSLRRTPGATQGSRATAAAPPLLWELTVEWNREQADPDAYTGAVRHDALREQDWWRFLCKVEI